jgi:hypothetical protein
MYSLLKLAKRRHYGEENNDPHFPYSEEIEDEYDNNRDVSSQALRQRDPKWERDYHLIAEYNKICDRKEEVSSQALRHEKEMRHIKMRVT